MILTLLPPALQDMFIVSVYMTQCTIKIIITKKDINTNNLAHIIASLMTIESILITC